MKCPHCGKNIKDPKHPFRPFCSERCKLIDLGKWISEEYRVAAEETDDNFGDASTAMKGPEEE
jgi:endogenous inhibitor of DNA gyrase (YacG/DUF329 family)